jgi:hypothetical protein
MPAAKPKAAKAADKSQRRISAFFKRPRSEQEERPPNGCQQEHAPRSEEERPPKKACLVVTQQATTATIGSGLPPAPARVQQAPPQPSWSERARRHSGAKENARPACATTTAPRSHSSLLANLNAVQTAAVTSAAPALVLIAGPGSGKTRVMAYRVAMLLLGYIGASAGGGSGGGGVAAISFTNKASEELKLRIHALVGGEGRVKQSGSFVGTFHSLCIRILHQHGGRPFSVATAAQAKHHVEASVRQILGGQTTLKARAVQNSISRLKNCGVSTFQEAVEHISSSSSSSSSSSLQYQHWECETLPRLLQVSTKDCQY